MQEEGTVFDYHKLGGVSPSSLCYHKAPAYIQPRLGICQHPGLGRLNQLSRLLLLHLEMNKVILTVHLLGLQR